MHRVAISSTGIFIPPEVISNEELVASFNCFADQENALHAAEIEADTSRLLAHLRPTFSEKDYII